MSQGGFHHENSEKLEFDDPLNENAMFLRSQGLQNEAKMVPKRSERKKKSRESSEKSAKIRRQVSQERSGAFSRETASPQGPPRGRAEVRRLNPISPAVSVIS